MLSATRPTLVPRSYRVVALVVTIALLLTAASMERSVSAAPSQMGLPRGVISLLPVGGDVVASVNADLIGDGQLDWAVLASQPSGSANRPAAVSLVIAMPDPAGWKAALSLDINDIIATSVSVDLQPLDGRVAVVVQGAIGAHATHMVMVRWDGAKFATVSELSSNAPTGIQVMDVDHDGLPEIINREPSLCVANWAGGPHLLSVYHWASGAFSDATGNYPNLIRSALAEVDRSEADPQIQAIMTATQHACLYGVRAYLAQKAGDMAAVAANCAQALALDPTWQAPDGWNSTICS